MLTCAFWKHNVCFGFVKTLFWEHTQQSFLYLIRQLGCKIEHRIGVEKTWVQISVIVTAWLFPVSSSVKWTGQTRCWYFFLFSFFDSMTFNLFEIVQVVEKFFRIEVPAFHSFISFLRLISFFVKKKAAMRTLDRPEILVLWQTFILLVHINSIYLENVKAF